jgi:hypothetical protein
MTRRTASQFGLAFLVGLALGCSDDPSDDRGNTADSGAVADSGATDQGVADTGADLGVDSGPADTGLVDSGVFDLGLTDSGLHDSGVHDTGANFPDGGQADAEVDAGVSCGLLGTECSGGDDCGPNLFCGFEGICVPIPECGGFVMASCPNTSPICLYYAGADIGPCFTQFERNCVCNNPNISRLFAGC